MFKNISITSWYGSFQKKDFFFIRCLCHHWDSLSFIYKKHTKHFLRQIGQKVYIFNTHIYNIFKFFLYFLPFSSF